MAKMSANALTESKRKGNISPTKYLEFSNARIISQDKYLDEVILAVNKPLLPDPTVAFSGPEYFKLDKDMFGEPN